MKKRLSIGFGLLFIFVLSFSISLTLATSASAENCICCNIMCQSNPNRLACQGHIVSGVGCVCEPCPPLCEGLAHTCLDL